MIGIMRRGRGKSKGVKKERKKEREDRYTVDIQTESRYQSLTTPNAAPAAVTAIPMYLASTNICDNALTVSHGRPVGPCTAPDGHAACDGGGTGMVIPVMNWTISLPKMIRTPAKPSKTIKRNHLALSSSVTSERISGTATVIVWITSCNIIRKK